jgi:uncharacterized protein YjbI with pentapeptide repeats
MNRKTIQVILPLLLSTAAAAAYSPSAFAFDAAHLASLRSGVTAWNKMRAAHADLIPDLSGADLKGRNLNGADLHNANLTGSDLSQSNLVNANLQNALMDHVKLSGSMLMKANLEKAELHEADLESAILDSAKFKNAVLKGSILKKADCRNTDFAGADLAATNLREASLVNASLEGADLREAYLWRANLSGAKLNGVRVSDITVLDTGKYASASWAEKYHALFVEKRQPVAAQIARLPENDSNAKGIRHENPGSIERENQPSPAVEKTADEKAINPYRAKERKAPSANIWRLSSEGPVNVTYQREQFEMLKSNALKWNDLRKSDRKMNVELKGAPFNRKNLAYADLNYASLGGAGFRGADLSQGDLRYADLRGCDFREANLQRADLGEADLRGANLWRANLSQARLTGAIVSGLTVLETGKKATPELAERYGMTFRNE